MNQLNAKRPCGVWGLVTGAAAVIAVLALLFLVPTSPALLVDEPVKLFTLVSPQTLEAVSYGEMDIYFDPVGPAVTAYAVCIAAGAALAIILTALLAKLRGRCAVNGAALALVSGAFGLVCSHLLFCAVRWSYIVNGLGSTAAFLGQFWQGGYTMYGAIFGGLLGAWIYALAARQKLSGVMDAVVPGMAVLLMLGRFAERYTLQGMGKYIDLAASGDIPLLGYDISQIMANEPMSYLPFALKDDWGGFSMIVYNYEAIFAGIALLVMLIQMICRAPAGRMAETGITLIGLSQIILESWRMDECVRFGFVRLNMILSAVTLAAVLVLRIVRVSRSVGFRMWSILRTVLLLLGAGVIILIEFALDKSTINNSLLYAVMALMLVMMGCSVLIRDGRKQA